MSVNNPRTAYKGLSYSGIYMNSCLVKMVGPTRCMALRESFSQGRFPDQPGSGCCGGRCKKNQQYTYILDAIQHLSNNVTALENESRQEVSAQQRCRR